MSYKLIYFDLAAGRGEVARLAFTLGGVAFEDVRITREQWPALKPGTPFGMLPVLEVDGQQVSQSNTIARYVGKQTGLYPTDPWQAALCDETMDAIEDTSIKLGATARLEGDERKKAREAMVEGPLRQNLESLQRRLEAAGGEFFAGSQLTVADLRVFLWIRLFRKGTFDHVPTDLPERCAPKLVEHYRRLEALPGMAAYYQA